MLAWKTKASIHRKWVFHIGVHLHGGSIITPVESIQAGCSLTKRDCASEWTWGRARAHRPMEVLRRTLHISGVGKNIEVKAV